MQQTDKGKNDFTLSLVSLNIQIGILDLSHELQDIKSVSQSILLTVCHFVHLILSATNLLRTNFASTYS